MKCERKRGEQPYCDALHVQLFEVEHTAQDGLLVPCLQGYGIPIQGELTQGRQVSKAGQLIPAGGQSRQKEVRPFRKTTTTPPLEPGTASLGLLWTTDSRRSVWCTFTRTISQCSLSSAYWEFCQ